MEDDAHDEVLCQLRGNGLLNMPDDPVKVVYHPDFVSSTDALFGMDYDQFVRGCHLGIFPSYYEPWGYTPLECVARGVPSVTSDLSGFGTYLTKNMPDYGGRGMYVVHRRHRSFEDSLRELAEWLYGFCRLERRPHRPPQQGRKLLRPVRLGPPAGQLRQGLRNGPRDDRSVGRSA